MLDAAAAVALPPDATDPEATVAVFDHVAGLTWQLARTGDRLVALDVVAP